MIRSNHTCYVLITHTVCFNLTLGTDNTNINLILNLYNSTVYKLISIYFKNRVAINNHWA